MTKIIRNKFTTGPAEGYGCDYIVNDNGDQHGDQVSTRLWHLFMNYPDPVVTVDDKGKALPKKTLEAAEAAYQETFEAEKAKAVAFVQTVEDRGPGAIRLMVHGDNAKTGDSVSAPDTKDPIKVMTDTWESVVDGSWTLKGGGTDALSVVRETLASLDAQLAGVMAMTKARKAAKDDRAALYAKIATARGVPVEIYEADLESRAIAAIAIEEPESEGDEA